VTTKADMPNTVLGRFISLEFLGMLVVMGISWGTLTARVQGLDERVADNKEVASVQIAELKAESSNVKNEVTQINRKLDVMGNNQEHFKESITDLNNRSGQILQILENEYKNKK
jgi:hypothetical protein